MRILSKVFICCFYLSLIALSLQSTAKIFASENTEALQIKTIEWPDLIPPEILEILLNPPSYLSEIEDGSVEDQISSQIRNSEINNSEDAYQQALVSTEVNSALDGAAVRIPGFIVPLEFDDQQTVTQFFLVPYFGACLHMPPPPPNQIILVNSPEGVQLSALYDPFWIEGTLSTTTQENDMATSAYSMKMLGLEPYIY